MTILSMLLTVTLGRPEGLMPITTNGPALNGQYRRSLWAAPVRSVCPPLDMRGRKY